VWSSQSESSGLAEPRSSRLHSRHANRIRNSRWNFSCNYRY